MPLGAGAERIHSVSLKVLESPSELLMCTFGLGLLGHGRGITPPGAPPLPKIWGRVGGHPSGEMPLGPPMIPFSRTVHGMWAIFLAGCVAKLTDSTAKQCSATATDASRSEGQWRSVVLLPACDLTARRNERRRNARYRNRSRAKSQ
jgi:hypothetical protein